MWMISSEKCMNYVSSIEGQLRLLSLQKINVNAILVDLKNNMLFYLAAPVIVNDWLLH